MTNSANNPLATSDLPTTILKTNPGVDKKTRTNLEIASRLANKANRSSEYRRKLFGSNFEQQRNRRKKLYDRLKPKLVPSSRNAIEKYKIELRKKEEETFKHLKALRKNRLMGNRITNTSSSPENVENVAAALESSSEAERNLSRRSSLRSSILEMGGSGSPGPVHTENPLGGLDGGEKKKPEVVVTKAKRKPVTPAPAAYTIIDLLPAPTPTRFVGKMHKLKGESEKKKSEESKARPKTASRRSSVAPSTETIKEIKETSPLANKASPASGGAKAFGKVKMEIQKESRKDSIATDKSSSSTTPSIASGKSKTSSGPAVNSGKAKSSGESLNKKKSGSGLAALKAKAGMFASKKKKSQGSDESTGRELKTRLFFTERVELSDEEILRNLGVQNIPKVFSHGLKEIAQAASMMKKLIKVKENYGEEDRLIKMEGFGIPTSILYVGALKARLIAREQNLESEEEEKENRKNKVLNTTRFLGKMKTRKDKHGLFRGTPEGSLELSSSEKEVENPVIVALEKVKLKPQISLDSSDSRAPSRASKGSHKSNLTTGSGLNKDGALTEGAIVGDLEKGLSKVKLTNIVEWNLHKHIRGDRELKPITVPF